MQSTRVQNICAFTSHCSHFCLNALVIPWMFSCILSYCLSLPSMHSLCIGFRLGNDSNDLKSVTSVIRSSYCWWFHTADNVVNHNIVDVMLDDPLLLTHVFVLTWHEQIQSQYKYCQITCITYAMKTLLNYTTLILKGIIDRNVIAYSPSGV